MNPLIIIFSVCILIWLSVLTFISLRIFSHYQRLVKGVDSGNLEKILKKVLENQDLNKREISDILKKISVIEKADMKHIQKIGMLRFNPFNETGGDNSFTMCFLTGDDNGIVITGLHTREKTRMYAKEIENGKSKYELSKEESKAIQLALK